MSRHAPGVGLALHQEDVHLGQHRLQEAPYAAVARKGPRRDAAVHDRDARAAAPGLVDQVRPDLRLDQDEQRGVQGARARGAPGRAKSKGAKKQAVRAAHALLGHRVAGDGGGGEEDAPVREALLERPPPGRGPPAPRPPTPRGSRWTACPSTLSGPGKRPIRSRNEAEVLARGTALPEIEREREDEADRQQDAVDDDTIAEKYSVRPRRPVNRRSRARGSNLSMAYHPPDVPRDRAAGRPGGGVRRAPSAWPLPRRTSCAGSTSAGRTRRSSSCCASGSTSTRSPSRTAPTSTSGPSSRSTATTCSS